MKRGRKSKNKRKRKKKRKPEIPGPRGTPGTPGSYARQSTPELYRILLRSYFTSKTASCGDTPPPLHPQWVCGFTQLIVIPLIHTTHSHTKGLLRSGSSVFCPRLPAFRLPTPFTLELQMGVYPVLLFFWLYTIDYVVHWTFCPASRWRSAAEAFILRRPSPAPSPCGRRWRAVPRANAVWKRRRAVRSCSGSG